MDYKNFRAYYDLYYEVLCEYLNYYTQDTVIIEDVLQEVFLKLWENKDNIEIQYTKTYLFHVAKNRMLNHLRDEENRHRILDNWFKQQKIEKQGKECFNMDKFVIELDKCIEQLPLKCKEIFLLSKREKFTYKQIAEHLKISPKTVEAQMAIALKRIRQSMVNTLFSLFLVISNL